MEPKTAQEVGARRTEILEELKATHKAAELAKRPLTKDERDRVSVLRAEDDQLKAKQAELKTDADNAAWLAGLENELGKSAGRVLPDVGAAVPTVPAELKKPAFQSLGMQLQAIAQAGIDGDNPKCRDPRLKWDQLTPISGGATSGTPSDGGYLVQKDFSLELLKRLNEFGEIKNRVRTIPISANSDGLKIYAVDETSRATGSRWGGVQVYWGAEADQATAKKPKIRQMTLELHDLIGLAYATDRLLADASAMEEIFMQAFSEEMSFEIENALINGSGPGQPQGVIGADATVSVAKETGQPAATISKENIDKMWSRLWSRSRKNAVWFINQDVEPQLDNLQMGIGTGGVPVYLPPGGLSQSPYSTLKSRPVIPVEYCATLGTTGDIILADFSQYIAIEKGTMQADSSIHVRFVTNEKTFRFIYRYEAQPVWSAALTPYKGSATKSPFVKLDTRA